MPEDPGEWKFVPVLDEWEPEQYVRLLVFVKNRSVATGCPTDLAKFIPPSEHSRLAEYITAEHAHPSEEGWTDGICSFEPCSEPVRVGPESKKVMDANPETVVMLCSICAARWTTIAKVLGESIGVSSVTDIYDLGEGRYIRGGQ